MLSLAKTAVLHRRWIQFWLLLCLIFGGATLSFAAKKISKPEQEAAPQVANVDKSPGSSNFDHFQTGFPLLGAHQAVPCESCHVRGVFKGTPTKCSGCHNGSVAVGKGPSHITTSAACDTCHNPASVGFIIAGGFDHVGVTGNCVSCHNGVKASGKGGSHIASTDKCEACHRNTSSWSVDSVDHSQVQGHCSSCHNGTIATGKGANHIPTALPSTRECDACHRSTTDWAQTKFGHGGVTANCVSCHDGRRLIGKDKTHIRSTDRCEACHKNTNSFAAVPKVDHQEVIGTCSSCHLADKPLNHIPTTQECSVCHNTENWNAAIPAHDGPNFVNNCARAGCHDGTNATGRDPLKHVPTGAVADCVNCHRVPPDTFDNAALFSHSIVSAQRCDSCHNGAYKGVDGKSSTHVPIPAGSDCSLCHVTTPLNWAPASLFNHSQVTTIRCDACHNPAVGPPSGATPKSATHVATKPGQDCKECHSDTVTFTGATFSHAGITNNCSVSCHITGSPGPAKDATHIPTPAGIDCNACHRVPPPDTFTTAGLWNHSLVVAQRCDACHNGKFPDAPGKIDPTHVPIVVGQDCGACHRVSPDTFATASIFNHTQVTSMRCDACHNGKYPDATGKPANHVATQPGQDCNATGCHKGTTTFAGVAFDHTGVTSGCGASGCHTAGGIGTPKDAKHVPTPTGMDCNVCHRVPPDTFVTAALFNHTLVVPAMTCFTCHTGGFTGAVGKGPTHIASTNVCEKCHRTTTWTDTIKPLDHTQVTGTCNSCHTKDKPATHIPVPTGSDCSLCHATAPLTWAQASLFNHSQVTAMRCDTCHGGTFPDAPGKGAVHIPFPAGQDCGACHRVPPDTFTTAALFNHNLVTTLKCSQCHSGQFTAAGAVGKGTGHFVTTLECDACHTTAAGWAARYRHTSANYPGDHNASVTCRSCHTTNTSTATWTSPALKPACGGCHERDFSPGDHQKVQTPATNYTAAELKDCTGACHLYATPGGAIVRSRSGQHRVNAGSF